MAQISDFVVAVIVFTMVVMCSVTLIYLVFEGKPEIIQSKEFTDFNSSFNKYVELQSSVSELNKSIAFSNTTKVDNDEIWNQMLKSGFTTFALTYKSFSFMTVVWYNALAMLGLSDFGWLAALVVALLTVLFVFSIYQAIFNSRV